MFQLKNKRYFSFWRINIIEYNIKLKRTHDVVIFFFYLFSVLLFIEYFFPVLFHFTIIYYNIVDHKKYKIHCFNAHTNIEQIYISVRNTLSDRNYWNEISKSISSRKFVQRGTSNRLIYHVIIIHASPFNYAQNSSQITTLNIAFAQLIRSGSSPKNSRCDSKNLLKTSRAKWPRNDPMSANKKGAKREWWKNGGCENA